VGRNVIALREHPIYLDYRPKLGLFEPKDVIVRDIFELTNEQRRKKFEDKVDKCARDEDDKCDAINISKFVADLEDDIPNLKRSSCDASLAGGCDFDENENKAL